MAGIVNGRQILRCAEVDAATRMPDAIFDPSNAAALKAYEDLTIALFGDYSYGVKIGVHLELGRCADKGYTEKAQYGYEVDWAPAPLMQGICAKQCACNFPCANKPLCKPDYHLPTCKDEADVPSADTWCSLCGPKFNKPFDLVAFFCGRATGPDGQRDCPGPDATNKAAGNWTEVMKDLLERL